MLQNSSGLEGSRCGACSPGKRVIVMIVLSVHTC